MVHETVLIVDSDAASLKLAAAVLRREGYKVQVASNGEQALTTLHTDRADLILVSMALPGLSAFELAARLKQDPRTAQVIAVALLSAGGPQAVNGGHHGFAGCLRKPLDPIELAHAVRDFLDSRPADEPAAPPADLPGAVLFSGPEADDLRRSFAAEGARQSRALADSLAGPFDETAAYHTVHQWAGAAYALGFEEISQRARPAAALLKAHPLDRAKLSGPFHSLVEAFGRAAARGAVCMPEAVTRQLGEKQIAMVGFAPQEAERLCEALAPAGALPRLFEPAQALEAAAVQACAVLLVHVRPETARLPWIRTKAPGSQPLVLLGRAADLLALDPAVQDRAADFLVDGWQPEEAVLRLGLVLARTAARSGIPQPAAAEPAAGIEPAAPGSGEVLIVDDDPSIRALVRTVLENQGIKCRMAASGAEGIAMTRAYHPSAALLDVNMPDMSGFEALPRIRAESPGVRVVMLTAREQEADIVKGFALGSDDYVVKPFIPRELVARVKRLL